MYNSSLQICINIIPIHAVLHILYTIQVSVEIPRIAWRPPHYIFRPAANGHSLHWRGKTVMLFRPRMATGFCLLFRIKVR
jgi:hypothetical protein